MSVVSSKAIVISTIKYRDSSLIVKLYTKEVGLVSYILKGILKSKKGRLKTAYFLPLTQLTIIANHQEKRSLQNLKEAQVINVYKSIHTSIVKQSVVLFLSEILGSAIQEQENNNLLYDYIERSLIWLDTHQHISNFHLLFLLNLTKFLGFYPDLSKPNKNGFHLKEGVFTDELGNNNIVVGHELIQLKKLLGIHFDKVDSITFSKTERQKLLHLLIRYFELHLAGFKKPKSLTVLETVYM
ncbi:MAG: DNA repair protein RecO [Flavobacterium sp. SCGC AAA160-P02]|nr:MAG: DNA repair protein RecO [Flavobacterium sp. SCGC AAA160-P02]